jgi:hypothetical protein
MNKRLPLHGVCFRVVCALSNNRTCVLFHFQFHIEGPLSSPLAMSSLFLCLVLACLVAYVACAGVQTVTILARQGGKVRYLVGSPKPGDSFIAKGTFRDVSQQTSGFETLDIQTSPADADSDQLWSAGWVEGYLTAERINQHYQNMLCQVDCSGNVPAEVSAFFKEQDAWSRKMVAANPDDTFWQHIGLLNAQFDGLVAGYAESSYGVSNPLSTWAFTMINAMGDLFDIMPAVSSSRRPDFEKMTYHQAKTYLTRVGHCSALLKLMDDMSDIYIGHNAWFVYSSMLRIYKTYSFTLQNKDSHATTTSFSSYPGSLNSLDDFYMMAGSNLVMVQTTNNIFNASLWDLIVPQSLLGEEVMSLSVCYDC